MAIEQADIGKGQILDEQAAIAAAFAGADFNDHGVLVMCVMGRGRHEPPRQPSRRRRSLIIARL